MSFSKLTCQCALVVICLICKSVYADTITIAADVWCPINCEPDSDKPGIMVEIAYKVFEKHGHEVKYITMPWSRTLSTVRRGELNAAIGAYKEDAPDFIFPKNEQSQLAFYFYVLNTSNWNYAGIDSLADVKLGVIKDYSYLDKLDAYIEKHSDTNDKVMIAYGNGALTKNIRLLKAGFLDTIIATDLVFQHTSTALGLNKYIRRAGAGSAVEKAYIAFSPNHHKSQKYAPNPFRWYDKP